jgi:hypothetical protein
METVRPEEVLRAEAETRTHELLPETGSWFQTIDPKTSIQWRLLSRRRFENRKPIARAS